MQWQPIAVFFVTLFASVLSGMAGGGGGTIITPFLIAIGLTPQQAIATGKFGSFGLNAGAVAAFRKEMLRDRRFSLFLIILAAVIGVAASFFVRTAENSILQLLMGALILAMVPLTLYKTRAVKRSGVSNRQWAVGTVLLATILLLQGIISGGVGAMVGGILVVFFGIGALKANVMKRKTSVVLNTVVVLSLLGSGLINYKYGLFGMAGGLIGGYIGSRAALKKGDDFARYALLVFMAVSGIWLLATA